MDDEMIDALNKDRADDIRKHIEGAYLYGRKIDMANVNELIHAAYLYGYFEAASMNEKYRKVSESLFYRGVIGGAS